VSTRALLFRLKPEATRVLSRSARGSGEATRVPSVASAFRRKIQVVTILLAAAAISVAAARGPKTHTVTIESAKFSPSELTVAVGDTVVWVNKDIFAHTATATSKAFDSKTLQPERSWRFVARKKGEFPYACSFHPMNGVLRVK